MPISKKFVWISAVALCIGVIACGGGGRFGGAHRAGRGNLYSAMGSEDAVVHYIEAERRRERGDLGAAKRALEKAISSDIDDSYLRIRQAEMILEAGDDMGADALIGEVLERIPEDPDAWLVRARIQLRRGDAESAEESALAAIVAAPGRSEARQWLAELLMLKARPEAAAALWDHVSPLNPSERLILGRVLVSLGRFSEACTHFGVAARMRPGMPAVSAELAAAMRLAGDKAGAADVMTAYLEANPADDTTRRELIDLLLDLGDRARAERQILSLPAVDIDDRYGALERAGLYFGISRFYDAQDILAHQLASSPADPSILLAMAAVEVRLGRLEAAALLLGDAPRVSWSEAHTRCREAVETAIRRWPEPVPLCFGEAGHGGKKSSVGEEPR